MAINVNKQCFQVLKIIQHKSHSLDQNVTHEKISNILQVKITYIILTEVTNF